MSYYDTVDEGSRWSKAQVVRELARHGLALVDLADDSALCPDLAPRSDGTYDPDAIIGWLGY